MDILGAYEKQNLQQTIQPIAQRSYAPEYGFFIRLVMRLSGGKIENARQASYVLLAAAGVIIFLALIVFIFASPAGSGMPLPYEKTYHPVQPLE